MVAGATGIDLFLLVIDAAEGARPQTHEHLAILRLLGVEHGVVARDEGRRGRRGDARAARSRRRASSSRAPRSSRSARRPAPGSTSCAPRSPARRTRATWLRATKSDAPDAALRRPRLHAARDRHGRDRDALGGLDRRRRRAAGRAGGPRGARPQRPGARPDGRARRGRAARRRQPAGRRARRELRRGDALVDAGRLSRSSYRLDVALERARADRRTARGCTSTTARPRSPRASSASASGYAQLRLAAPVVAARGDRVVLRARDDARRRHRARPCPAARARRGAARAARARRARGRRSTRPCASRSLRHCSTCDGSSSTGARARRRLGCSRSAWLDELARGPAARGSTRPTRSTPASPPPPRPWARGGRAAARARAPRREALRARRDAALGGARRGRRAARARARRGRLRPGAGRGPRARRATSSARAGSSASATASRSAPAAYERGARTSLVEECERAGRITLARFRDLLGTSRRPAQLLLERFDADGLTRRVGDERVLRRRARS